MKLLSEYKEYLESQGYELEYTQAMNGELTSVTFIDKYEKIIELGVYETSEWAEELRKMAKESDTGEVEYDINPENYIVDWAQIILTVCSERNFLNGDSGSIYLVNDIEESDYYTHSLELFKKCVSLQKMGLVEHELEIMKAHINLLDWANKVLIPVLEEADYVISYSSLFDVSSDRENSDLLVMFEHYNESNYDYHLWMATDCITGEYKFAKDLDLYGKSKEEVKQILLDKIWRSDDENPSKYTYLYRPEETKDSYKEYVKQFY